MKPTIVIVHGAWHVPEHYSPLSDALRARGFDVHVPHLPSTTAVAASKTQTDDVDSLRAFVSDLISGPARDVVVLAHSYGGMVSTQALGGLAAPSTSPSSRGATGGGVVHLIYMAAFMLRRGETVMSVSMPRPEPEIIVFAEDGSTHRMVADPVEVFYGDVEEGLARRSAGMLVPSAGRGMVPVTEVAWEVIPTTYVVCTQDRANVPEWQWGMIEAARREGVEVEVEVLEAGHSPFLSKVGEMVGIVEKVAARYG